MLKENRYTVGVAALVKIDFASFLKKEPSLKGKKCSPFFTFRVDPFLEALSPLYTDDGSCTANSRYNDSICSQKRCQMNLLLYRILNEQIDL